MEDEIEEILHANSTTPLFRGTLLGLSLTSSLLGIVGNVIIIAIVANTKKLHDWTYLIAANIAAVEIFNLLFSQVSKLAEFFNFCIGFNEMFAVASLTLALIICLISERIVNYNINVIKLLIGLNGFHVVFWVFMAVLCSTSYYISEYLMFPLPFMFFYVIISVIVKHVQRFRASDSMSTQKNVRLAIASVYVFSLVIEIFFGFIGIYAERVVLVIGYLFNLESFAVLLTAYVLDRNFTIGLLHLFRRDTTGYDVDATIGFDDDNPRLVV